MNNKSLAIHLFCLLLFVVGCGVFWMINVDKNENENENVGVCQVIENKKNHITLEEKGRDTSHNTSIKSNNGGVADTSPFSPSSFELDKEKAESNPVERKTIVNKKVSEESSVSTNHTTPDANIGFNPIEGNKNEDYSVNAVVYGQQSVSTGSLVKLRLSDDINIDGVVVTKNTVVYAKAKVFEDRVYMQTEFVTYRKKDYPLNAKIYDLDGKEGVSVSMSDDKMELPSGYRVMIKR